MSRLKYPAIRFGKFRIYGRPARRLVWITPVYVERLNPQRRVVCGLAINFRRRGIYAVPIWRHFA